MKKMKLKQKIGTLAVSTAMAATMWIASLGSVWAIDYQPITDAIKTSVGSGVSNWIAMVAAQTDLFTFLVLVGIVSVLAGLIFYFLNKAKWGGN